MKLITIIGARPQFIKAAPISRAFAKAGIIESIVHTGQHFDAFMSDIFFEELEIPRPEHHLGISGRGHGAMTGEMLQALEPLLQTEFPDLVLVYGDTNSTIAGALAAAKLHIPVAHMEAGLRSFNRKMPEEQNRIVTDHLSDLLFTPTDTASARLLKEGIPEERIHQVGDVMYDATLLYREKALQESHIISRLELTRGDYVLATLHRAENTDNPECLRAIIYALENVSRNIKTVILPLHPRTHASLIREKIKIKYIHTIDPVGYLDMIALEASAAVIATDSGGVQKEAYFQSIPCVTLRGETEWNELIELGWNRLAPPTRIDIAEVISSAINTRGRTGCPYGTGQAAEKTAKIILEKIQ